MILNITLQVFCALREWEEGEHNAADFTDIKFRIVFMDFLGHLRDLKNSRTRERIRLAARCKEIAREGLWVF